MFICYTSQIQPITPLSTVPSRIKIFQPDSFVWEIRPIAEEL